MAARGVPTRLYIDNAKMYRSPQLHDAAGVATLAAHLADARGAQPGMTVQNLANELQLASILFT